MLLALDTLSISVLRALVTQERIPTPLAVLPPLPPRRSPADTLPDLLCQRIHSVTFGGEESRCRCSPACASHKSAGKGRDSSRIAGATIAGDCTRRCSPCTAQAARIGATQRVAADAETRAGLTCITQAQDGKGGGLVLFAGHASPPPDPVGTPRSVYTTPLRSGASAEVDVTLLAAAAAVVVLVFFSPW